MGGVTNVKHRKIVGRIIMQTAFYIFHCYYKRRGIMSSNEISRELKTNFYYRENTPKRRSALDPEVNTAALVEHISSLDEKEIREGLGNLVIWLRGPNGRYREPMLSLEEGFHSIIKAPAEPAGKVINDEMVELLLERTWG